MTDQELLKKIAETREIEPDAMDLAMIEMAKKQDEAEKSGRVILRLPKTLHKELVNAAKAEGVSLNQYCLYKLAK